MAPLGRNVWFEENCTVRIGECIEASVGREDDGLDESSEGPEAIRTDATRAAPS